MTPGGHPLTGESMKRIWIGLLACALCLFAAAAASLIESEAPGDRVHQHLDAAEKAACSHGSAVFCTHLPLLEIETGGVEIPGKPLGDGTENYTVAADGSSKITCKIELTDHETANNHPDDEPQVASDALIGIRGRSSRSLDMNGYALRLQTAEGENNPQSLAGMAPHHEWVLHGPFLDKSLMRNYMWYNIAGEIMDYAPNVRFCELILNGEYMGVYLLVESITAGDDGARLNLTADRKGNRFSGYALRLDDGSPTPIKNIDPFSIYSYRFPKKINIVYPGADNLTEELAEEIRQDFSAFEKALYSFDFDDDKYGYKAMIDVESFVAFMIINEFTLNYDAGWLSTYVYKDLDGLLRMCIWDFNSACDNYQDSQTEDMGFQFQNFVWYFMLTKDDYFIEAVIDRYAELREDYLSEEYLMDYIDGTVAYLGDAVDRNFEKWGYSFAEEHDMLQPASRNPRTYEEAIAQLKSAIRIRGDWMDENIHTLRQYAAESKVKKFIEHTK